MSKNDLKKYIGYDILSIIEFDCFDLKGVKEMKSKQIQLNKQNNVGLYYRLSKDDDREGESLSIENQRNILRKYVTEKGWNIYDEYIDDGISGTTFEREGVQRLLEDAKNGIINTIIVKDLSRFGRNYIEVGTYIDYIFPTYGIRFIALTDNIDTANGNSSAMDMMPIMNVFNEWFAANTSRKIRAVFVAKARAGKFKATYIPYGYLQGNEKVPLIIDEETAPVIRRIFEMRASGMGKRHISTVLTQSGIPTPSERRKKTFGVKPVNANRHGWSSQSVKEILSNPVYIGSIASQRTTTVSYKNHKIIRRPESEWIIVENTHEAIISKEVWNKCREIDLSVSQGKSNKQGIIKPLSGLVYCPECGAKMRIMYYNAIRKGIRTDEKISVFNCSEFISHGKENCNSKAIKEDILNEIVLRDIKDKAGYVITDEESARAEFFNRKSKQTTSQTNVDTKRLMADEQRFSELTGLIQSVYEDKVSGKIPEDICVELLFRYQQEKASLSVEITVLKEKLTQETTIEADVEEFIRRIKKYSELEELDRATAMDIIEYITVGRVPKDKDTPREINIYYKLLDKPKERQ